jgi:hypothetical protein
MGRRKKNIEIKFSTEKPGLPEEPPILEASCACCHSNSSLKVFVVINETGWLPPHHFDTFCTKKCAKTWYRPTEKDEKPRRIVEYKKWTNKKEIPNAK